MIGICKNEHGWYISKHNKQLGVKYYKTLTEVMPVAYAEEYSSRSNERSIQRDSKGDYQGSGSIIEFLKRAREVRTGKTQKRREARKKYVEKQLDKADLPFWW